MLHLQKQLPINLLHSQVLTGFAMIVSLCVDGDVSTWKHSFTELYKYHLIMNLSSETITPAFALKQEVMSRHAVSFFSFSRADAVAMLALGNPPIAICGSPCLSRVP